MSVPLILAVVGGAAFILTLVLVVRFIGGRKREAEARARARVAGEAILLVDEVANGFGVESSGMAQVRGNGCLVLGAQHLAFATWAPKKDLCIAREKIVGVEKVTSHLGRTKGVPLLKVRFRNDDGADDSAAWFVRGLDEWLATLSD